MNVNDEKNANTTRVRFETSTSPSWKDIKIFIKKFFKTLDNCKNYITNYKFRRITKLNTIL